MSLELEKRVEWIKETVMGAGAKGLVFGLSGGIDSAVVAGLAMLAFPETSLGLIMPCESLDEDEEDALLVANALGLPTEKVDLTNTYRELIKASFDSEHKMAKANIKPRLRMTTLYYYAQSLNRLVAGGSNKSELYLGYYTKHGDSGVDMLLISDLVKEEVFELAEELKIPKKIIDKKPSAGLWKGQTDEDEMGFRYKDIDGFLRGEDVPEEALKKITRLHSISHHKRRMAPMFKGTWED